MKHLILTFILLAATFNQAIGQTNSYLTFTPGASRNNFDGVMGRKFSANSNLTVYALARYNITTGNSQPHVVALFDYLGNVLGSVTNATAGKPVGFTFTQLAVPINLVQSSNYFVASVENNTGDAWSDSTATFTETNVTTLASMYANGTNLTVPVNNASGFQTFVGIDLLFTNLWSTGGGGGNVTNITASSCSFVDVSNAVFAAQPGNVVLVPAGVASWVSNLYIGKDIQLIGAGIDQTIIIDEEPRASREDRLINWTTQSNGVCRLSGFTFRGGVVATSNPWSNGTLDFNGYCGALRIDHCKFENLFNENIYIQNAVFGVVDHCIFTETNWGNAFEVENGNTGGDASGWGDVAWATPVPWGTTNNFVVIEDSAFTHFGGGVADFAFGSEVVFRHNNVTNAFFLDHGTESTGRARGGRAWEVYANNFFNTGGQPNIPLGFRSGTGIIYSNTFNNFAGFWSLQNFRSVDLYGPWGSANGLNTFDSNNPAIIDSGTHTGTNSQLWLTDSAKTWTINQFVGGYTLLNIASGATNSGSFAMIYSNGVHDIYYLPANQPQNVMRFTNGQAYKIYQSYAELDQVGRGQGDLILGGNNNDMPTNVVTGLPTWPREASEPVYQWANSFNGTANYVFGPNTNYGYSIIQAGRDYIEGTVKPAYTALVYPHPLTLTATNAGGITAGKTAGFIKISQMPLATSIAGTELIPAVQSGSNVAVTASQIAGLASNPNGVTNAQPVVSFGAINPVSGALNIGLSGGTLTAGGNTFSPGGLNTASEQINPSGFIGNGYFTNSGVASFTAGIISFGASTNLGAFTNGGVLSVAAGIYSAGSITNAGQLTNAGVASFKTGFISFGASTNIGNFTNSGGILVSGASYFGNSINVQGNVTAISQPSIFNTITNIGATILNGTVSNNSSLLVSGFAGIGANASASNGITTLALSGSPLSGVSNVTASAVTIFTNYPTFTGGWQGAVFVTWSGSTITNVGIAGTTNGTYFQWPLGVGFSTNGGGVPLRLGECLSMSNGTVAGFYRFKYLP